MRLLNFQFLILISALIWVGIPVTVLADTDFGELVVTGDMSPQERLAKKVELTQNALSIAVEKAETMKASLEKLEFGEKSAEEQLKSRYLNEVSGYLAFYQERRTTLDTVGSLEEVDALIQTVIKYRESVYAPSAKNVLEFILVFSYNPSVLSTTQERYNNIKADVERLGGLDLVEGEQFTGVLEQCRITLEEAEKLQAQARGLVLETHSASPAAEETPAVSTVSSGALEIESIIGSDQKIEGTADELIPTTTVLSARELTEESLNKIKGLYDVFIETGQKIKEALGI